MKSRVAGVAAAGLAAALVAGGLIGTGSGTLEQAPPAFAQENPGRGPSQAPGQRPGLGPVGAGVRDMMQAVGNLLGMEPREIAQARRAGRSLADIAAERGVDQATLLQTITSSARTRLDQAVADGRLTRERADSLLNDVQQFAPDAITRSGAPAAAMGQAGPGAGPRRQRGADGATPGPRAGRSPDEGDRGPRQGRSPDDGGRAPREGRPTPDSRDGAQSPLQSVADLLGMTPEQIMQERQAGRSLADIATARGVARATLVQTLVSAAKTRLDRAVAAGRLPQERADALAQRIEQAAERRVAQTDPPGTQLRERVRGRLQRDGGARPDGAPRGPRGGESQPQ